MRLQSAGGRPEFSRRPKHLFSGLVFCGRCGGSMTVQRIQHGTNVNHYLGCSSLRNSGTCDNHRNISTAEISARVLVALQKHLLKPDLVELAVETYRKERERLAKEMSRNRRDVERDLAAVERKIQGVIAAIEAGGNSRALAVRLNELEAERRKLEQAKPGKADVVAVHPKVGSVFAETVRKLQDVLGAGRPNTVQAVGFVRELIDRIEINPTPKGTPVEIDLVGNLTALFMEPSANRVVIAMVAGAGFEPTTFRL
ncbi:MAG: recombinase zinc beta ribbon domain-containing protein [Proteobacteria bacterium]|nr:recombinase zinc beta ribbon domain-containing protein [Pseudomonadota bacterium]